MSRNEVIVADAPKNDRPADKFQCGQLCQGSGIGNCARGPRPDGACGSDSDPCTPERTFRGLRRRSIVIMTFIGIVSLGLWSIGDSSRFFKPGDLSKSHAVIFNSQTGESHCAACHPNAATSMGDWFRADDMFHHRFAQTDSCVACHHVKMPNDVARLPHNLSAKRLLEIRTAWAQSVSTDTIKDTIWTNDAGQIAAAAALTDSVGSVGSVESIECASCHREHGGTNAIMTAMSNAQCQSCHSRTFESFRDGHPDWRHWPHVGAKVIVFDHATHQRLHFPKAAPKSYNGLQLDGADSAASPSDLANDSSIVMGRDFDCRSCHPGASSAGEAVALASFGGTNDLEPLRTVSFEVACADCHAAGLKQQSSERLDLFALPTLTSGPSADLGPWPEAATGFFDGEIGPLTQWLINDGPQVDGALSRLPGAASITQIDPTRADQVRAAVVVAGAIRRAMEQFSVRGGNVVLARENQRAAGAMRQVLRTVPPQLVSDARRWWFDSNNASAAFRSPAFQNGFPVSARPFFGDANQYDQSPAIAYATPDDLDDGDLADGDLADGDLSDDPLLMNDRDSEPLGDRDDVLASDDALLGDPLSADPLAADPLAEPSGSSASKAGGDRFDPIAVLPDGGWYRDDLRLAISYRGSGHADPVLKAAVELAATLPTNDSVRKGLLATSAVSSCVRCHVGAMQSGGSVWKTPPGRSPSKALTKFSHKPHFNLPQLSDCSHCHLTDADAASIEEIVRLKAMPDYDPAASHGFISIGKSACVVCHTKNAAGETCTQCHHYHSHR